MNWAITMRKKISFAFLLLLFLAGLTEAQIADKANIFGGITYQYVGFTPVLSPVPTRIMYVYGIGGGMDFVLAHSNDVASIGVNPNANLCFQFNSYSGLSFLGSVPVYMLARVGAGATPFNEQKFGIGIGAGGSATYLYTLGGLHTAVLSPSAVAEISLRTRGSNYLFRFNWNLLRPTQFIEQAGLNGNYRIAQLGLSIFYTF